MRRVIKIALVLSLVLVPTMGGTGALAQEPPPPEPETEVLIVGGRAVIPEGTAAHLRQCSPTTDRVAGGNRFATAEAVADLANSVGGRVFVAQGRTFADALAAGAAANAAGTALALVEPNSIPIQTQRALDRLAPDEVVVVGGPAVISDGVVDELAGRYGAVSRVAGPNRYATAVEVSRLTHSASATVIVATGESYIDALAAAPLAAEFGAPLLLVAGDALPPVVATELSRLDPSRVFIIGGTAVVAPGVASDIGALLPEASVERVAGANRYSTAKAISDLLPDNPTRILGVTSSNFPDALAAGSISRANPLVLLDSRGVHPTSASMIESVTGEPCEPMVKLSTFTTYHDCCQSRVTNIQRIADEADNAVVAPGDTFSLNDYVGERTEADGYVAAGAIVGGALVCCDHPANIGGGTSQFATTLYNAIFYAGLEDIEHRPHSVYFSRYPLGIEATLNWTSPDVEFRNDTDWPIMLDASYTSTSITVDLWGWSDNRTVTKRVTGSATTTNGGEVQVERWVTYGDGSVSKQTWNHTYRGLKVEPEDDPPPPPPPPPPPGPNPV